MKIKVLGLLGSPHNFGGTGSLLRCALEGARNEGAEVEIAELYQGEIKPCQGCIQEEEPNCRFPCIFEDYGRDVLQKIEKSQVIIFATPVYWYAPSGIMKILIDRLTCLENMVAYGEPSYMEGKIVGVITVGADAGLTLAGGYLLTALNAMGALIPPWAHAYSRCGDKALDDEKAVMDAINVGLLSVRLAQRLQGRSVKVSYLEDKDLLMNIKNIVMKEKQKYREDYEKSS